MEIVPVKNTRQALVDICDELLLLLRRSPELLRHRGDGAGGWVSLTEWVLTELQGSVGPQGLSCRGLSELRVTKSHVVFSFLSFLKIRDTGPESGTGRQLGTDTKVPGGDLQEGKK